MRKPNEVWVAVPVLEQMLSRGMESWPLRVVKGPDPKARIVDAHHEHVGEIGAHYVVLIYDRPVDEPVIQEMRIDLQLVPDGQEQGLEKLRRVARDIEQR